MTPPARLAGRVALVTGGSSGIGQAVVLALVRDGARVVFADRTPGTETLGRVQDAGGTATYVPADVCRAAEVEALVARAVAEHGRLDCAVNNAGTLGGAEPTAECTPDNWTRTLAVNLTAVFLCMRQELRQMVRQGAGAIVNTASAAGLVGVPGWPAYVASKHGVVGLTKTAALEYAAAGIRVNAVCPGVTDTPLLRGVLGEDPAAHAAALAREPIGRMARPDEIAAAVVWLCSDAASFVTGIALPVDGGMVAW